MTNVPDSLTRFQSELEAAIGRDLGHRRRRARVARPVAIAATAAVAAAVAVPVLLVGGGPSIVEKAEAALTADSGEILHTRMLGSQTLSNGTRVDWQDETWQLSGSWAPRRQVHTTADGRRVETATTTNGRVRIYDPDTDTIYEANAIEAKAKPTADGGEPGKLTPKETTPPASKATPPEKAVDSPVKEPQSPQEKIKTLLGIGKLREDGHVTIGGRDAIRLVSDTADLRYVVDAESYAPIEFTSSNAGETVKLRFPVYDTLPSTAGTEALLSLTAQHPNAKVDSDPAHFRAAWSRLFPAKG